MTCFYQQALWIAGSGSGLGCTRELETVRVPFREATNICRASSNIGNASCIADEWQRGALCRKSKSGNRNSVENLDSGLEEVGAGNFLGQDFFWRRAIRFISPPQAKRYRFFYGSDRGLARGDQHYGFGKWRSEFCEATEARSSRKAKSVKAPTNFVWNPQKGSQTEQLKNEARGQHGDLDAMIIPPSEPASTVDSELSVKVIGIGATACSILHFCQQSTLLPSAQFWMYGSDSALQHVQLSDPLWESNPPATRLDTLCNQDPLVFQGNKSGTIFIVLGAGKGTGLGGVPGQLKAARSKGLLAVGIFIQPFMFEGQKRLEQANQLIDNLRECTDLMLVVEQDTLLRREAVTVSEASTIANNAVLLSIKAIAESLSGKADLLLGSVTKASCKTPDESKKLFEMSGKAWLGSGKGHTIQEAIEKAMFENPLSGGPLLGEEVSVLCTVASAAGQTREDMVDVVSVLQHLLGSDVRLVLNSVNNPTLEDGVSLALIIISGLDSSSQQVGSSGNFSASSHIKYGVPITHGTNSIDSNFTLPPSIQGSVLIGRNNSGGTPNGICQEGSVANIPGTLVSSIGVDENGFTFKQELSRGELRLTKVSDEGSAYLQKEKRDLQKRSLGKKSAVRSYRSPSRDERRKVDTRPITPQAPLASSASKRSWLALGWEAGPSSAVAEAWAQARAEAAIHTNVISAPTVTLPVGVRLTSNQSPVIPSEDFEPIITSEVIDKWAATDPVPVDPDAVPRNRMVDMGLGAVMDMYNAASALVMGKEMMDDIKPPSLTQRAASMLESERSQKKLTPMVEMDFKNGIYKGRCQGGLPEGKGRLTFSDGSFYDGQWKQGKRAGAGAFYYANGDLFQGSWKDDVMHGKGWMYYHNGDRLYANFWRGKAHGEGRFYSAQGDVFFGQFRDNWRHGECLHIEASGVRWTEIWESGIFKSRTPDDS